MYSVLNTPPEYTYLYFSKNIPSYTFVVFKSSKAFNVSLTQARDENYFAKNLQLFIVTCIFLMKFSHGHLGF